jgi:hypothetical protein
MSTNDAAHGDAEAPRWDNPLTVVAGALLLTHLALKYLPAWWDGSKWPQDGGIGITGLALAALAILPWVALHLSSAKLPGGIDLAFREVERRQDLTEQAIRQLRFIVDGFLTRDEYQHLLNIHGDWEYEVKRNESGALAAELRRLRALGLIANNTPQRGITDFTRLDGQKRKIAQWFRLTPRGEEYLRMRSDNQKIDARRVLAPAVGTVPLPEKDAVLDRAKAEE